MLRSAILCSPGILGLAACGATHGAGVVSTTAATSGSAASVSGGQAGFADTGQDALHRAQSDPDVQQAYLAKNLGG